MKPKGVLESEGKRGARVLFTALAPGTATITGKQAGTEASITIKVNAPADRSGSGANDTTVEMPRLFLDPRAR